MTLLTGSNWLNLIMPNPTLPPDVQDIFSSGYWRIDIRPERFQNDRIPYDQLDQVLRTTKVRLRGWDFPHLTNKENEILRGQDYLGVWSNFANYEYWRFFQSAYLFHLKGVREVVDEHWKETLERDTHSHLDYLNPDWASVRGYFSIINFLYTVTEAFVFASRLTTELKLNEPIEVEIRLKNIAGYILTTEINRGWDYFYQWKEPDLNGKWLMSAADATENFADIALNATVWFFQRFGWLQPNLPALRNDQHAFLAKRT